MSLSGRYPLFKGATRLPTWLGVPRTAIIMTFMFCGALFMHIHLYALALFAVLWFIEWLITRHDDRMFGIIALAFKTKVINRMDSPYFRKWGGSSYSPTDYGSDR